MSLCLGCAGSSLAFAQAFSSCGERGAVFVCGAWVSQCSDFPLWGTGPGCTAQELWLTGSAAVTRGHRAFISCGSQAPCLQLVGLAAPRHMESSGTRIELHVPGTGRYGFYHCANRKSQWHFFSCVLNYIFHNKRKFSCFTFYKSLSCLGYYNKRRFPICFCIQSAVLVEVYEENLASHR